MKIITCTVWQMTDAGLELLEEDSFEHEGAISLAKGAAAPAAPDPAAQSNIEAAANRYNTTGPSGSTTWDQGDVQVIGYDSDGNPQYGNNWTQQTTLNPSEQAQYDKRNQIAEQLLSSATSRVADSPFSYDSATPEVAKAQYDKQMRLLQPEFAKSDDQFEQKWANAGIPVGSDAYNDVLRQHEGDQNTTRANVAADAVTQGNQLALTQRNQNYNELAAALGSNQIQMPNAGSFTPIDAAGNYRQQYESQLSDWNASQAEKQGNKQAGVALGAAALSAFF